MKSSDEQVKKDNMKDNKGQQQPGQKHGENVKENEQGRQPGHGQVHDRERKTA
jgi:hypothetical protein